MKNQQVLADYVRECKIADVLSYYSELAEIS